MRVGVPSGGARNTSGAPASRIVTDTARAVFDPNSAMASVSVPAKTPVSVPDVASP